MTFGLYLSASLFIFFFSVAAIQGWDRKRAIPAILLACGLPFLSGLVCRLIRWRAGKPFLPVEKMALAVGLLGSFNIFLSEDRAGSLKGMGLFLITALPPLLVLLWTLNNRRNILVLLWTLTAVHLSSCLFGFYQLAVSQRPVFKIVLFSGNPIPAGSFLLLLAVAPTILITHKETPRSQRLFLAMTLFLGILLLFLIGKRGPLLALIIVLLSAVHLAFRRWRWTGGLLLLLLLSVSTFVFSNPALKNTFLNPQAVQTRLELLRVGLQIWKEHPVWGIGWNAPLAPHVPRHHEPVFLEGAAASDLERLLNTKNKNTLDNLYLSMLVQGGTVFTLCYFGWLVLLFAGGFRRAPPGTRRCLSFAGCLLAGFAVHSLTYDSLKFPDINWAFHSILGLWAGAYRLDEE